MLPALDAKSQSVLNNVHDEFVPHVPSSNVCCTTPSHLADGESLATKPILLKIILEQRLLNSQPHDIGVHQLAFELEARQKENLVVD